MAVRFNMGSLIDPLKSAIDDAFAQGRTEGRDEGYAEGYAAAIAQMVATVEGLGARTLTDRNDAAHAVNGGAPEPKEEVAPAARAPRGALDPILDTILAEGPGMTTQEVEAKVAALDPRIAIRSVYNRLRFHEKSGRRFRRRDGQWYRVSDLPSPFLAAQSSPQGETGGVAPPVSANVLV